MLYPYNGGNQMPEREGPSFKPEYFFAQRRKGTIYTEKDPEIELPLPDGGEIISLEEGVSPFGPPYGVKEILDRLAADGGFFEAVSDYNLGTAKAEENIRRRFKLPDDQQVFLSSGGSDEIIERLTYILSTGNKRRVWGVAPNFPDMSNYIERLSLKDQEPSPLTYAPIYSKTWDSAVSKLNNARERIKEAKSRSILPAVYVCNPGTPVGDITPNEDMDDFINFCEKNGNLVILDEAFLPDDKDSLAHLTNKYSNLIVMGSLSKVIALPGAGIGYMVTSKGIEPFIEEFVRPYHIRGVSALLANEFTDPDLIQTHQQEVKKKNVKNKALLLQEFKREGFETLGQTDMRVIIASIDGGVDNFYFKLRTQGIKTAKGGGFFSSTHAGPHGDGKFEDNIVRFHTPEKTEDIPKIVNRFVRARASKV